MKKGNDVDKIGNMITLSKAYNPKEVEEKNYSFWEKAGFFNPETLPKGNKKPFSIVIPPPNITGSLHIGHALNTTVQDILIRWKRLSGYKTLFLPGIDHAGIATQNVVEKELKKEGLTRFNLGKEKFIEKIWQWKKENEGVIINQFKKLGASCDWSRLRFTMDEKYSEAVKTAFLTYYRKGLIYKGVRPINFCPRCQTSLSDLELEYEEKKGKLYYINYPLADNSGSITVATTRPETMLGDTAVAVNPNDKRYKNLVGKKAILPLVNREIPIISDRLIDPDFGTGAVKVTPAHDLIDHQIGLKNKLEMISVIDQNRKITDRAPIKYRGLGIEEARQKVLEDLEGLGLLIKAEDLIHNIPYCYRCHSQVEVLPSEQWFLKMDDLAKVAIKAVKDGKIRFYPKRFEKIYFDWLKNLKDWCISRQLWWGHKIPIEGNEDVLDTWFSSALWPFATMGWPEKTEDLKNFYPTDILVTARDLISLWVTRMIFSGLEFMNKIPFQQVFFHPTVLTKEGKRMSKSLGTGSDPVMIIEKYGADATRFGLIWQIRQGQDIKFLEDHFAMGKKFCNKIWNASRFILTQLQDSDFNRNFDLKLNAPNLTEADKKILRIFNEVAKTLDKDLENFHFGQAAQRIYKFFWHNFCDYYIEESKKQLQDAKNKTQTLKILLKILLNSLILLHPFIPFITEEVYLTLPIKNKKQSIMIETWPK